MRTFRKSTRAFIAAIGIAATLAAGPAHAVFLEADKVDANGVLSTIDLWFFSFNANASTTIKVNDLGGPPIAGADPDLVIYLDDGTFSNVFASDTAAGTDPAIAALFPARSYIGVVANHPLVAGLFGPTHADSALAVGGYDYEFNGPEPVGGEISIDCLLSGNLGGGYTKRVLSNDTCSLPPSQVPEPPALGLFAVGLMCLGLAIRRRRLAAVQA